MNCKCAAFLKHSQCFKQQFLFICAGNIVINIITCNRIKSFIGKIKFAGIAFYKFHIAYTLCFCVFTAQHIAEIRILLSPSVKTDNFGFRISFCARNCQRTAAAADIKAFTAVWYIYVIRGSLNNLKRTLL